jgi:diguanylate cyclase (GGDEF)-like protein
LIARIETIAPFTAGGLLIAGGVLSAGSALGFHLHGDLQAPLPVSLLISGAGIGIVFAAWEKVRNRGELQTAQQEVLRAHAQRDMAMLQARRMRAQAEGLALMREIHRSTVIPQRHERLHRILTLIADLFEAREVSLFAASGANSVLPAACLRITNKEEVFIAFDTDELSQALTAEVPAPLPRSASGRLLSSAVTRLRVAKNSATIAREGCHLFVEGMLELHKTPVAKAQWRRGAQANHDPLTSTDPAEILETGTGKIDYSSAACILAAQALERRRTVRLDQPPLSPSQSGMTDGLVLCVPLLADQRPVGVLRIRRSLEGFSGPEAEALEELLLESAKHIALAMKKDEDDRKAITDVLTGLFIKRHFLVTLEKLRADSASRGQSFCLILCDIDHFKKVNDTHGHLTGDMILKGVASVLRKALRGGDIAFRYGGEEMAVLLPGSTLEAAEQTAERLRTAVQSATFLGEKGQTVPVTISLGIAQHQPGLTGETLISRADKVLYMSKQNGRNRATAWMAEKSAAVTSV